MKPGRIFYALPPVMKEKLFFLYGTYPYQPYMDRLNCIFVHIPKAAGTSLLFNLSGAKPARYHASCQDFQKASPTRFKKYYKFCFVRNPVTRLFSAYNYLKKGGNLSFYDRKLSVTLNDNYKTFDDFVGKYLNEKIVMSNALFRPQYLFILNQHGDICVDFIGRVENIDNDYLTISERLDIPKDIKKLNTSGVDQNIIFSKRSLEKIINIYYFDFKILGYDVPSDLYFT